MPPTERDEEPQPPIKPASAETVKHIPASPDMAETQDSDLRLTAASVLALIRIHWKAVI